EILTSHGYKVDVAHDMESAVDAVSKKHPDVVLLDINLPRHDGFAVYQQIKKVNADHSVSVIAITGSDDPVMKKRALKMGFDAYLLKPLTVDVLLKTIRRSFVSLQ